MLTSAPGTRTSNRVAESGTPGAERIRIDAARESYPYDAVSGAHIAYNCQAGYAPRQSKIGVRRTSPPSRRLYELMVGHIIGTTEPSAERNGRR